MKKALGAVAAAVIIPLLFGIFGCKKEPEYTVADIKAISISCGSMDSRQSYSFRLSHENEEWTLFAECTNSVNEKAIDIQTQVTNDEAEQLLLLVEKSNLTDKLEKNAKRSDSFFVADKEMYSCAITFSDGRTVCAPISPSFDIEAAFRSLAEKYGY